MRKHKSGRHWKSAGDEAGRAGWAGALSAKGVLAIGTGSVLALGLVGTGVAFADGVNVNGSIPGPNGVIHGCYNASGLLRLEPSADACQGKETAISWNQKGPQGPQGKTGPEGPQGPTGPAGPGEEAFTSGTATYTVPAGVSELRVELWGGGGGGADTFQANQGAGGGGSGAFARALVPVTGGETCTVVVGAPGTGSGRVLDGVRDSSYDGLAGGRSSVTCGSASVTTFGGMGGGGQAVANPELPDLGGNGGEAFTSGDVILLSEVPGQPGGNGSTDGAGGTGGGYYYYFPPSGTTGSGINAAVVGAGGSGKGEVGAEGGGNGGPGLVLLTPMS
jgi:hypothetical protein